MQKNCVSELHTLDKFGLCVDSLIRRVQLLVSSLYAGKNSYVTVQREINKKGENAWTVTTTNTDGYALQLVRGQSNLSAEDALQQTINALLDEIKQLGK